MAVVFFDLDGVLINSKESFQRSWSFAALQTYGERTPLPDPPDSLIGYSLEEIQKLVFGNVNEEFSSFFREGQQLYEATDALYPEVQDVLQALKSEGHILGVLSSRPHVRLISGLRMLDSFRFDLVLSPEDDGFAPKPSGEGFLEASRILQKPLTEFFFVGDSLLDQQAATDSGVRFLWASWGFGSTDGSSYFGQLKVLGDVRGYLETCPRG